MLKKRRKADAQCRAFNKECENKHFFEQTAQGTSLAGCITFSTFLLTILVNPGARFAMFLLLQIRNLT